MVGIDRQILVVFSYFWIYDPAIEKSIIFIRFKLLMTHFIRGVIFHTFSK